ncbi:Uncharacterised protein [Yersinia enterocolitica]|uniref:Uncharacterized protein n=1 Tax=Yersinia enterocolitica TaxID=630 RepID=A0A9P1PWI3_YEREN|nr:Uncharacterised protein [Yersinia enterocolitica]CNF87574.1 Uncharacterised protein [Yersinia enterocolitica]CQH08452.1 Uncharacterised protein [Yersinia enterocolitica]
MTSANFARTVIKLILFIICFSVVFLFFQQMNMVKSFLYDLSVHIGNLIGHMGEDSEGSWIEFYLVLLFLLAITSLIYMCLTRYLFKK